MDLHVSSPNMIRDRYGDTYVLDLILWETFTLTVSGLHDKLGY